MTESQMMTMDEIRARMDRQASQLFAVFMRPTQRYDISSDQGRELLRRHLQFQFEMEDRGTLLAAGPLHTFGAAQTQQQYRAMAGDNPQPIIDASGMYFIVAASPEAAEAIACSEPFEQAGWRTHVLHTWSLNEGRAWRVARELVNSLAARS